jgi:hypothetical protein
MRPDPLGGGGTCFCRVHETCSLVQAVRQVLKVLSDTALLDTEAFWVTSERDVTADALGQGAEFTGEVRVDPLSAPHEGRHSGPQWSTAPAQTVINRDARSGFEQAV